LDGRTTTIRLETGASSTIQRKVDYIGCFCPTPRKGKSFIRRQLWNECSRLIANAVIYYNTAFLSGVYAQKRGSQFEVFEEAEGGRHFMFIENPEKFN
jgi:hypothetical protein